MLVLSRLDALVRRLLPGLFMERTKSGAPISVSDNGTTSVDINTVRRLATLDELIRESEALGLYDIDPKRAMINMEADRAETWKGRAELAEAWHWKAAAALADCRRRFVMPDPLRAEVDKLLQWTPE
jgi:hypothetical protein